MVIEALREQIKRTADLGQEIPRLSGSSLSGRMKTKQPRSCWLSPVSGCCPPRQPGTGGRAKLLGISKRGDLYLHTLLIHGARWALLAHDRIYQRGYVVKAA